MTNITDMTNITNHQRDCPPSLRSELVNRGLRRGRLLTIPRSRPAAVGLLNSGLLAVNVYKKYTDTDCSWFIKFIICVFSFFRLVNNDYSWQIMLIIGIGIAKVVILAITPASWETAPP